MREQTCSQMPSRFELNQRYAVGSSEEERKHSFSSWHYYMLEVAYVIHFWWLLKIVVESASWYKIAKWNWNFQSSAVSVQRYFRQAILNRLKIGLSTSINIHSSLSLSLIAGLLDLRDRVKGLYVVKVPQIGAWGSYRRRNLNILCS